MIRLLWLMLFATADFRCPHGSPRILEKQALPNTTEPRELVLWMCGAERNRRTHDPYTCPDQTTGHFYRGRAAVSLVDVRTHRVINTVPIHSPRNDETFDLPYKIARHFYHVPGPLDRQGEGTPKILSLKDYNGDAYEFALFHASNCTVVQTTLFGYSKRQDRVLQYPLRLIQKENSKRSERQSPWLDRLFLQTPISPGHWKWQQQYHVGGLTYYDIRYNAEAEAFEGEITIER